MRRGEEGRDDIMVTPFAVIAADVSNAATEVYLQLWV